LGPRPWRIGRGTTQDLDLLLQDPVAALQGDQLLLLAGGRALDDAVVDVGLLEPTLDRVLRDPEVLGDLRVGQTRGTGHSDHVTLELGRVALRHGTSFPRAVGPR